MEQDVIDQLINRFAEKYPYKMAVPKHEPPAQQPITQPHTTVQPQQPQPQQPQQPALIQDEQTQEPIQHQPQPYIHQSIQPEIKSEEEILLNQLEQLEQLQNIEFPNRPQHHHQDKGLNMNFWLFVVLIIIIVGIIIYLIMRKR